MSRIIRKSNVQGQRIGQLISNSLYRKLDTKDGLNVDDFHQKLFYIENDELEQFVQDFLDDPSWTRTSNPKH